jgi:circadian clock protein KaiC
LPDLDAMLEGGGYYRGSTVLVSGAAGSGKSTLAAAFAIGTCERGEPCLLLAFEESARQMIRNMRSVGLEMEPWVEKGLLEIQAVRPTLFGLEEHLVSILQRARSLRPAAVIIDPVTDFFGVGRAPEIKSMVTRVLDQLRNMQTTVLLTSLTAGTRGGEGSGTEVSSLMDTWIVVNQAREGTERRRYMYVVKARGTNHSNAMRELVMSSRGLTLHDVAPKPAGERGRPCPGGGES